MGLRFVGAVERRDSLQFENDLVVDHDVSLLVAHVQALVGDGESLLWLEWNAAQSQFVRQCLLVDGLQACPELVEGLVLSWSKENRGRGCGALPWPRRRWRRRVL
jgi:hypothetical protein